MLKKVSREFKYFFRVGCGLIIANYIKNRFIMFICQTKKRRSRKNSKAMRSLKRRSTEILQLKLTDPNSDSNVLEDFFIPGFVNKLLWSKAKCANLERIKDPQLKFSTKLSVSLTQSFRILISKYKLTSSPDLLQYFFIWGSKYVAKTKFIVLLDQVLRTK